MARSKKKTITIKDPETLAILGVVCLVLSGVLTFSLFINHVVLSHFKALFGLGVPVMSVVLFLAGLRLLGAKRHYNTFKVIILLMFFLFCFLGWIHLFASPDVALQLAQEGKLGGLLGYWISNWLKDFSSVEIAFLILSVGLVLSFGGALDISPRVISEWIASIIDFTIILFKWLFKKVNDLMEIIIKIKTKLDEINLLFKARSPLQSGEDTALTVKFSDDKRLNNTDEKPDNNTIIKMVSDISVCDHNEEARTDSVSINFSNNLKNTLRDKDKYNVDNSDNSVENMEVLSGDEKNSFLKLDLSVRRYPNWQLPPLELLDKLRLKQQDSKAVIERKANAIIETLKSFNIEAKILGYSVGPAVTQFFIDPAAGIKFSRIASLSKDLALTLASPADLRIELVPGKSYIGIDVPNDVRQTTQLIESIMPIYQNPGKYKLGIAIGIDNQGNAVCRDLASAPHLLIAGATGQGKSVLVNAIIVSLLMQKTPDELKFIMIDPKMVEMAPYDGIPHLLMSPITDMANASKALKWAVNEMENRYKELKEAKVRSIEDYISQTGNLMPYIVIVIDEFSDLIMQFRQEVETSIIRLAQKSRAVGIHLVIATQRPTADVITGLIKSNIPARVALSVASSTDSRVILDSSGAETLLGKGDLLIKMPTDLKPVRVQGLYINDKGNDSEFGRILSFIKNQAQSIGLYYFEEIISAEYDEGGNKVSDTSLDSLDPLFEQAAEIVISAQKASASLLQTKMKIGYARAARLIDQLEQAGIVGPQDGPRPRQVNISNLESLKSVMSRGE